jgi:hypothetical protein
VDDERVINYLKKLSANADIATTDQVATKYLFDSALEVAYLILREADTRSDAYRRAQKFIEGYSAFTGYLQDKGIY